MDLLNFATFLVIVSLAVHETAARAGRVKLDKKIVKHHEKVKLRQDVIEKIVNQEFDLFDQNKDDEIDVEDEVQDVLDELEYADDEADDEIKKEAIDFMDILSEGDDDKFNRHEVMLELLLFRTEKNLHVKGLRWEIKFHDFDDDRNTKISIAKELPRFLEATHAFHPKWQLRHAAKFDTNKDGELSGAERRHYIQGSLLLGYRMGMIGAFTIANMFDTDKDNHLNIYTEIQPVIERLGGYENPVIKELLMKRDANHDKKLSINDLRKFLKTYFRLKPSNMKVVRDIIKEYSNMETDSTEI